MPPFRSLLKSREVEDPVNIYFNRPLAYAFVSLVYRTSITPNQVTFLAVLVGFAAASMWFVGTKTTLVVGGVLLWTSGIIDGADGILARAKNMQSQFGRALDGVMDMLVAIVSLSAAFYRLGHVKGDWAATVGGLVAIGTSLPQIYLYDFYKESYLRMTRPGRGSEGETLVEIQGRLRELQERGAPLFERFVMSNYVSLLQFQSKAIGLLDPMAKGGGRGIDIDDRVAETYKRHNFGPMRAWAAMSLAPHTYLLAICAMFDRFDIYAWLRLVFMNVLFVITLVWQRYATRRTREELSSQGVALPAVA